MLSGFVGVRSRFASSLKKKVIFVTYYNKIKTGKDMIEIRQVKSRKDLKQFVLFGIELYKGAENFCPPLIFDEINTFCPDKNPAHAVSESICFLAWRDGRIVGRIAGIINHEANRAWNQKRVRFGWFDFVDEYEVSEVLLAAVEQWGKSKGMEEMNGPLGFTDFDHQGLLLEGFEYDSPMASLYNYPYYPEHFEKFGLSKEMDWIEYRIFPPTEVPERMARVGNIIREKYGLNIVKVKSAKELKRRYGYTYLDVIDAAYQPLYNFQPLTPEQKKYYCDMYFPLLNYDFVTLVTNKDDEIVGCGVGMPNISHALRKCGGRLLPFGWFHVLRALKTKHIESFDLLLIAVRPDYQNKGINSLFFIDQIPYFIKYGIKSVETTAILEVNAKNQANFEYFEKIQHKRRRAYLKKI